MWCLQGLEEIIVKNKTDIYALLDRGSAKRRTAETLLNKQSSRSHSVFCITVSLLPAAASAMRDKRISAVQSVHKSGLHRRSTRSQGLNI